MEDLMKPFVLVGAAILGVYILYQALLEAVAAASLWLPGVISGIALIIAIVAAFAVAIFFVSKIPSAWAAFKEHLAERQMTAAVSVQQNGRHAMSVSVNTEHTTGEQEYGRAQPDFAVARRDILRHPDEPQSSIAHAIIVGARVFAGIIMLVLWLVIIGPVWFAMLLRTIAAFSIATVFALFTSASPPSVARLDAIAELWVRGFTRIASNFMQREYGATAMYIPLQLREALQETGLAIVLYIALFASFWTIAHLTVSVPVYIFHLFWPQ